MIKTTKKIKRVAFFGDASAKETDQHFIDAQKVANLLVKNGYIVINGGGPGIMLASSLGAKAGGGKVELVILNPQKEPGNYEGINQINLELADRVYTTESYPERLQKLIEIADAFVIFKGGVGTLSEVGMTWEAAKFDYGHHEPLIFFGDDWEKILADLESGMDYENKEKNVAMMANSPQKVLEILTTVGS